MMNKFYDKEQIKFIEKATLNHYEIDENGFVNSDITVSFSRQYLKSIPVKFGRVDGNFDCSNNLLENLNNAPYYIGGSLETQGNKLKNFKGSIKKIEVSIYCGWNNLTSLKGLPKFGEHFQGYDQQSEIDGSLLLHLANWMNNENISFEEAIIKGIDIIEEAEFRKFDLSDEFFCKYRGKLAAKNLGLL